MKAAVLCVVFVTVLLWEAESAAKPGGLECHSCTLPNQCKKWNTVKCEAHHDTCQRSHTVIQDYDGVQYGRNDYESTTKGILVWERLCTTERQCLAAQKKKKNRLIVTCCKGSNCNA